MFDSPELDGGQTVAPHPRHAYGAYQQAVEIARQVQAEMQPDSFAQALANKQAESDVQVKPRIEPFVPPARHPTKPEVQIEAELQLLREAHAAELEQVRKEAFAAGLQQAQDAYDQRLEVALGQVQNVLQDVEAAIEARDQLRAAEMADLAVAVAELLAGVEAGDLVQTHKAAAERAIQELEAPAEIVVYGAPDTQALLEDHLGALADRLHIVPKEGLQGLDMEVAVNGGFVSSLSQDRRASVERILAAAFSRAA